MYTIDGKLLMVSIRGKNNNFKSFFFSCRYSNVDTGTCSVCTCTLQIK